MKYFLSYKYYIIKFLKYQIFEIPTLGLEPRPPPLGAACSPVTTYGRHVPCEVDQTSLT